MKPRCAVLVFAVGTIACGAEAPLPQRANTVTTDAAAAKTPAADRPVNWLDRQPANWNVAGQAVTTAPAPEEPIQSVLARCRLTRLQSTPGERAIASAGWIPFHPGGQQVAQNDVEIVGGMTWADGMCRPASYNLFVFVTGAFAGSLSPTLMTSRLDGASGAVQLTPQGIAVEFLRYKETDPLCCPSSRVMVQYRIDRTQGPVVMPISVTPTAAK